MKLVPLSQAAQPPGSGQRLPSFFDAQEAEEGEEEGAASAPAAKGAGRPGGAAAPRLYYPPASAGHNTYTLLKCVVGGWCS